MGVDRGASLQAFLDELASKEPTPGGGSAAALAGALAAGLTSMVCRLTVGKKGYEDVEAEVEALLEESEALRNRFEELVEEDAVAYDRVAAAMRMDRSTEEAKGRRAAAVQDALHGAAEVPRETARRSVEVLRVARDAAAVGNVYVLSDAGTAAHLAVAAFEGAVLNVEINLAYLKTPDYVAEAREELGSLREEARELQANLLGAIADRAG